jgi:hypothetical protein
MDNRLQLDVPHCPRWRDWVANARWLGSGKSPYHVSFRQSHCWCQVRWRTSPLTNSFRNQIKLARQFSSFRKTVWFAWIFSHLMAPPLLKGDKEIRCAALIGISSQTSSPSHVYFDLSENGTNQFDDLGLRQPLTRRSQSTRVVSA